MIIISKVFRKLNSTFLADEGEEIPISDYVWFYGFNGGGLIVSILFFIMSFV